MKERPILFSSPMVRAILAGTKTQTRRIVKPQPVPVGTLREVDEPGPGQTFVENGALRTPGRWGSHAVACPYGEPGDRLWVRETWSLASGNGRRVVYRADLGTDRWPPSVLVPSDDAKVWKPSIHMKRADSRITLEITNVRVERLQAISEKDAEREGCSMHTLRGAKAEIVEPDGTSNEMTFAWTSAAYAFATLWAQINGNEGPKSWQANPWVWAITFRRGAP